MCFLPQHRKIAVQKKHRKVNYIVQATLKEEKPKLTKKHKETSLLVAFKIFGRNSLASFHLLVSSSYTIKLNLKENNTSSLSSKRKMSKISLYFFNYFGLIQRKRALPIIDFALKLLRCIYPKIESLFSFFVPFFCSSS